MKTIRTRIAPSPTGIAHVGTLYMAIFNYAFAKQQGGQFLVRSEDTDRARFVAGAEQIILDAVRWVGIEPDEDVLKGGPFAPYRQSERLDIYKRYVDQLLADGHAYYCFATPAELQAMREAQQKAGLPPKYDGRYRDYPRDQALSRVAAGEPYVIRMRVPEGKTSWRDMVRGEITIDHAQVDDQVLMKSDGFPTYHLAVVVDDHLMEISHILRGEEWISSTPKHIMLYHMFGWDVPTFGHMPLLRNRDHSKLSKRKNDVSVVSYQEKGYLPEALANFLMLMGWSHPEGKEFLSLSEFVRDFVLDRIQTTGPIFDMDKLNWMNGKYIREHLSANELLARLDHFVPSDWDRARVREVLPLVRDRLVTLQDFAPLTRFFFADIAVDASLLIKKSTTEEVRMQLTETTTTLAAISWTHEAIEATIRALQEQHGWKKSQYFMMLRVAVTGETMTPPLFETMALLGQDTVLQRLRQATAA